MKPSRASSLLALAPLALAPLALALASCGGGGTPVGVGQIAGTVLDLDGNPVRDARVFIRGRETRTNSFGSFLLDRAPAQDVTVQAEVTQGNANYYGQNVAQVFEGDRTRSVNITVYPRSELAKLVGITYDRNGNRLSGVQVFVRPTDTNILSSARGISDSRGEFRIEGLHANTDYGIFSNAPGYGDDADALRLNPGETRDIVVTLGNATSTQFAPPSDLAATAYTSPRELTRSAGGARLAEAYEALKRELDPKRASRRTKSVTRDTAAGNPVEVELTWFAPSGSSLLGYGVYRGQGTQSLSDVDFLRDPLAEIYTDSERSLVEGRTYSYALTSLSTSYPDAAGSESNLSDIVSVTPLGDLTDTRVVGNRFSWNGVLGATRYALFLFDEYPRLGVTSRYNNFDNPTNVPSLTYDGPALSLGRTYYYLVLALNDDGSARSLSRVESFVAR